MAEEYKGYLRRTPQYGQKSFEPQELGTWTSGERSRLDNLYDIPNQPYASWQLKRSDLRRKAKQTHPNITDDQ